MASRIGMPQIITYEMILSRLKFASIAGVSLTCGKLPSGIGTFKNLHKGSHPCFASKTSNRFGGTTFFTCLTHVL